MDANDAAGQAARDGGGTTGESEPRAAGDGDTPRKSEGDGRTTGTSGPDDPEQTTVTVVCTGHVRREVGRHRFEFAFEGDVLRDFLAAFFDEYPVEDLLLAETETDATAHGWATPPDDLPGTWRANPAGEQTRAYTRVTVDGTFNEHLDGLDTPLADGDRVALLYPFIFCC